jgi:DNA-binding response OmpR family regulator
MAFDLCKSLNTSAMPKKILIVDDNEFMVEIMTHILHNKGYEVVSLYTGDEVLSHIKTDHPDLIILDIMLPGMDGRDICKAIKLQKSTRNLPVIICSGEEHLEESMYQKGAPNDILHKPFDINALLSKVAFQLAA